MIYLLMLIEFFKIGLFAIGGGLATVPFLFDLSDKYGWFSKQELADMIAVSESTPGPIGVNMASFAGFNVGGVWGTLVATIGLVMPSMLIMILVAKLMQKYGCNVRVREILEGIRPAVLALVLFAGLQVAKIAIGGYLEFFVLVVLLAMMRLWKQSPIFYIGVAAVVGVILKM